MTGPATAVRKAPPAPPAGPAARPRRRALRGILGAAAALLLAAGAFLAFGVDPFARRVVTKAVREALGTSVEIRDFDVRFRGKAELGGARIGNPGGYSEPIALEVASLDAFLEPSSLFGEEIRIHDMLVIRPTFTVEFLQGTSNVAVLVERLLEAIPADAPKFRIERLRVREAVVRLRSPEIAGGRMVFHLPDLEIRNFGDAPGTASTAHILMALFLQLLAGGAMEQDQAAWPGPVRKAFGDELERSSKAIQGAGKHRR